MLQDVETTVNALIKWTQDYFDKNGKGCKAVLGISGGKDSTVTAALLAKALGKERVIGVLMPNGIQADIDDSRQVISVTGIESKVINIEDTVNALIKNLSDGGSTITEDVRINIPPRVRMATLYAVAQGLPTGGRVINTCNRSEDYIGYSTKFGDSAGDVSLLAGFVVEEVRQIGDYLGLPSNLVHKKPSDGLCGLTDEDKIGFTYETLDKYILTGLCEDEITKSKIDRMHNLNLHKLELMPHFEL
ncbi:MAG: NAD(+) synthase [Butyrivibrio sp.]|nr:NAD(+) synthase [Butyrivibrio sp.]